jgi:hypothetical protein
MLLELIISSNINKQQQQAAVRKKLGSFGRFHTGQAPTRAAH